MTSKSRAHHKPTGRLILAAWLSVFGVILYNNWVLAIAINLPATLAGATTSELGVAGQPHYLLFRWLDVAAGTCFILGAPAMTRLAPKRWLGSVLHALVIVLGGSTIIESLLMPLQCSSALSAQCAVAEASGGVGWLHQLHIVESMLSYGLIALLPAIVMLLTRNRAQLILLWRLSLAVTLYIALWTVESVYRELHHARSYGYEQRLFILLFSWWYFTAVRAILRLSFQAQAARLVASLYAWQRHYRKGFGNRLTP